jgi:hypothetical protein
MKFNELKLLLEKNIYYKLPKDKEEQLYDFYLLTYLQDLPENKNATGVQQSNPEIESSLSEATKLITDELKPKLLSAIEFAVAAEFRHIFVNNGAKNLKKFFDEYGEKKFIRKYAEEYKLKSTFGDVWSDRDREELVDRFKENSRGYLDSYKALKKTKVSTEKIMEMATDAFKKLSWERSYGGTPWSNIAKGWLMLNNAKTYKDKVIAIDHVYDLQHNTNTVFNKLKSYYKNGYNWIKQALDHKRDIKNVWELVDKASPSARQLAGYVAHAKGYGSLELFQQKAKEQKATTDDANYLRIDLDKLFTPDEPESEFDDFISNDSDLKKSKNNWIYRNKEVSADAKYFINDDNKVEWTKGTWQNGEWKDGVWKDGVWKNGAWKQGTWYNGVWVDGTWIYGVWKNGTWENGMWKKGTWENGTWKDGKWFYGIWRDGIWEDGTWVNGVWKDGTWHNGVWENGTWKNGEWQDGVWKNGIWQIGSWKDGTWEMGKWKNGTWFSGTWKLGYWKNGTWLDGVWQNGRWWEGTWEDGTWENGTWLDGTWEDGTWKRGSWKNGEWKSGVWEMGEWEYGTWEYGTWDNGNWEDGKWEDGTWYNGTWKQGTWDNGTWEDGVWKDGFWKDGIWEDGSWQTGWIYDKDKKGNYKEDWEWDGNWVQSPINPKKYFE